MSQTGPSPSDGRRGEGKLYVVGIGPGGPLDRTRRAEAAIRASSVIAGYKPYLERIADIITGQRLIHNGMRQEVVRVGLALDAAAAGEVVALISSGDAGIYGMAGLALEMAAARGLDLPIEIVAGVSAANAAAARIGAPLMLDYATISLSDLLVPWEQIERRLEAVFAADLVVALYNPKSKTRIAPFETMLKIAAKNRAPETPVVIAHALGQPEEQVELLTLAELPTAAVTMQSILLIGNSTTKRLGNWVVTPRGYGRERAET